MLICTDDIIIHDMTCAEHDENLKALFERLQEVNLTVIKHKCLFGQSKITFYGYVFSESGLSPDLEKVQAIKNVAKPANQSEVRSFLGMTNYLSKFIDGYSSITEPLRQLMKQDVKCDPTPARIIGRKGSMLKLTHKDKILREMCRISNN